MVEIVASVDAEEKAAARPNQLAGGAEGLERLLPGEVVKGKAGDDGIEAAGAEGHGADIGEQEAHRRPPRMGRGLAPIEGCNGEAAGSQVGCVEPGSAAGIEDARARGPEGIEKWFEPGIGRSGGHPGMMRRDDGHGKRRADRGCRMRALAGCRGGACRSRLAGW